MLLQVLFSAIGLTALYNFFVLDASPGIGLSLFLIACNTYLFILRNSKSGATKLGVVASLISATFALLFAFRANSIVQLINSGCAIFALAVAGYFYKTEEKFSYTERFLLFPFILLGRSLAAIGDVFKLGQSTFSGGNEKSTFGKALLRGLLGAVPLVIILLLILTSADPIFSTFVSNLFSNLGERTVISLIVFVAALLVGFAKILHTEHKNFFQTTTIKDSSIEYSVIAGSVGLIFAVFIAIQMQYLFNTAGERELAALGISENTYSEYVRKGFFELLLAAGVASAVILAILRYLKNAVLNKQTKILQWIGAIVSLETLIVLASAAKRLLLYADAHGLTRARIFGSVFLLWMAVILGFFIIKLFNKIGHKEFFISIVGATIIALYSVSFINVDRLVAIDFQPTVNSEVDYFYIARLSPDAVDGWEEAIADAEKTITQLESKPLISADDNRKLYYVRFTLDSIAAHMRYLDSEKLWKSRNLGEERALVQIKKNTNFEKVPSLRDRAKALEDRVSQEAKNSTQIDRATEHPLSE